MPEYIIIKASRSPANLTARTSDAYQGPTCNTASVPTGQVYTNLEAAKSDAKKLKTYNIVGFRIWQIGQNRPLLTTNTDDTCDGIPIPKIDP